VFEEVKGLEVRPAGCLSCEPNTCAQAGCVLLLVLLMVQGAGVAVANDCCCSSGAWRLAGSLWAFVIMFPSQKHAVHTALYV
jgi:hypothetical protein